MYFFNKFLVFIKANLDERNETFHIFDIRSDDTPDHAEKEATTRNHFSQIDAIKSKYLKNRKMVIYNIDKTFFFSPNQKRNRNIQR
jgi:hypothetical protein